MAAVGALAQPSSPLGLDALVTNSPFGKSQQAAGAGAASNNPLEFRGVFIDNGETYFSVVDTATKRSMWIGAHERGSPVTVKSYDEGAGVITVEYQGRSFSVELKQSKVVALPAAAPVPPPPAGPPANAPAGGPTPASISADEARRHAQIAEEIQRRRAMRAQAMQRAAASSPANPVSTP